MANERINDILKDLTEDEIQLLKDTIRYCCWGDSYAEFLTDGEVIEDSMVAYCINDAKKIGRFSGRKISSMFRSIKSKVCPSGKGEVISHCSHWWGDRSSDMLFIRHSWVNDFEKWVRDEAKYEEWAEASQIPEDVMTIVQAVCKEIGIGELEEQVIEMRNRGGIIYGYGKGFALTHCTSSLSDGPSLDYTPTFIKFLGGLGFRVQNSYCDNGRDSATNLRDTFWTKEVVYEPSIKYIEYFK